MKISTLLSAAALLAASSAFAGNIDWIGTTSTDWAVSTNWNGGVAPTATDVAVFTGTVPANMPSLTSADQSVLGLSFGTAAGGWTLASGAGRTLTVGASGIDASAQTSGTDTLSVATLALGASQSWNVGAGGTLSVGSLVTGANGLTLTGAGNIVLSKANYTGATAINAGKLVLSAATGYASSTTTIGPAGVLELNTANTAVDVWRLNTVLAGSGVINVNNGTSGWVQTAANANTFSGTVNILAGTFGTSFLNSNWTGVTADFNISSGALLDARAQAITVGSLNGSGRVGTTYTNNVSGGNFATVNVGAGNKSGNFFGVINGDGSSGINSTANPNAGLLNLVKIGTGTQTLSGVNTFTGTTTVNAGVLNLSNAAALGKSMFAGGAGSLVFDSSVSSHAFTFGGLSTGSGSTLTLSDNAANAVALTIGANNRDAAWSGSLAGAGSLIKTGNGVQSLSGVNTYTGTTTVNASATGALQFAQAAAFYNSASGAVSGAAAAKLIVNSGATAGFNIGGTGEFTAADITTILNASTGGVGFLSGSALGLSTDSGNYSYTAAIADTANGPLGLTKLGANTLTLTAANAYTGLTTLTRGFLVIGTAANTAAITGDILINSNANNTMWFTADNQLSGTGMLSFGSSGANGRFNLAGTRQTLAGIADTTGLGVVQDYEPAFGGPTGTNPGTLTLAGSGTYSFNGFLRDTAGGTAGTLTLLKTGSGTQTLSGSHIAYAGGTTVSGGRLILQNTAAVGTIANSATVEFAWTGNSPVVNTGTLSGGGDWYKTGSGRSTVFNSTVNATGNIYVREGTLSNDGNASNWSGSTARVDISSGAILDLFADSIVVDRLTGTGFVQNNYGNSAG